MTEEVGRSPWCWLGHLTRCRPGRPPTAGLARPAAPTTRSRSARPRPPWSGWHGGGTPRTSRPRPRPAPGRS